MQSIIKVPTMSWRSTTEVLTLGDHVEDWETDEMLVSYMAWRKVSRDDDIIGNQSGGRKCVTLWWRQKYIKN